MLHTRTSSYWKKVDKNLQNWKMSSLPKKPGVLSDASESLFILAPWNPPQRCRNGENTWQNSLTTLENTGKKPENTGKKPKKNGEKTGKYRKKPEKNRKIPEKTEKKPENSGKKTGKYRENTKKKSELPGNYWYFSRSTKWTTYYNVE